MSYTLTIAPGTGSERVIDAGKLSNLRFTKRHTALGDWQARTGFDLDLADRLGDEIHLEDGTEFLFRGFLRDVQNSERFTGQGGGGQPSTYAALSGKGIGFDLTRQQTTRTPQNVTVADAISNVWALTGFAATVTGPTANTSTTGESVQEANTDAEFSAIASAIGDTDPLAVQNTNIELLKSCFVSEGEDNDEGPTFGASSTAYSGGSALQVETNDESIVWYVTPEYDIPAENVGIQFRDEMVDTTTKSGLRWLFNGEQLDEIDGFQGTRAVGWRDVSDSGDYSGGGFNGYTGADLNAGQTYELELRSLSSGETSNTADYHVDVVAVYDDRFNHDDAQTGNSFDNSVHQNDGYLNDPREYPHQVELELDRAPTTWSVNKASVSSTANDSTNNFRIQIRLPPNGTYGGFDSNNPTTITDFGFGSDVGTAVNGRVRLSSYPESGTNPQAATPRFGYNGQKLQSWEITIDGDDEPVYTDPDPIEGSWYQILVEMHDDGRMQFTLPHEADAKPAESYPIGGKVQAEPDWTIRDRDKTDTLERGYANSVTVRGATGDDGTRIEASREDTSEINDIGREHRGVSRPQATTQTAVDRAVRQLLRRAVNRRDTVGMLSVVAIDLDAGFSYPFPWADGTSTDVIVDEVTYRVRAGELRGRLKGDFRSRELATLLGGQSRELRGTQLAF